MKIIIYTTHYCPYCVHAKQLLERKNLSYDEINVEDNDALRQEMMDKSQRRTVPQIFINERHIGGYDDLKALDDTGELDKIIHAAQ